MSINPITHERMWLGSGQDGHWQLYEDFVSEACEELLGAKLKKFSDEQRLVVTDVISIATQVVCAAAGVEQFYEAEYRAAVRNLRAKYAAQESE